MDGCSNIPTLLGKERKSYVQIDNQCNTLPHGRTLTLFYMVLSRSLDTSLDMINPLHVFVFDKSS